LYFFLLNWKTFVRFEVFTAVIMKNAVFWDVAAWRACVNRRSQGGSAAHAGFSLADFSTLKMEAILSSETNIWEDTLKSHLGLQKKMVIGYHAVFYKNLIQSVTSSKG
jgi:hypothetical protein